MWSVSMNAAKSTSCFWQPDFPLSTTDREVQIDILSSDAVLPGFSGMAGRSRPPGTKDLPDERRPLPLPGSELAADALCPGPALDRPDRHSSGRIPELHPSGGLSVLPTSGPALRYR